MVFPYARVSLCLFIVHSVQWHYSESVLHVLYVTCPFLWAFNIVFLTCGNCHPQAPGLFESPNKPEVYDGDSEVWNQANNVLSYGPPGDVLYKVIFIMAGL